MPRGLSRAHALWLIHALGPSRNPLRRLSDRVTAVVTGILLAAMLLAVPFAAVLGNFVHEQQRASAAVEATQRNRVDGVISAPKRIVVAGFDSRTQAFEFRAQVRWTGSDGTTRLGDIRVAPGSEEGSVVPLWVDAGEHVAPPPRTEQQVLGNAVLVAVAAMLGTQVVCAAAIVVVWWIAEVLAHRAWQREWEIVQPEWNRG